MAAPVKSARNSFILWGILAVLAAAGTLLAAGCDGVSASAPAHTQNAQRATETQIAAEQSLVMGTHTAVYAIATQTVGVIVSAELPNGTLSPEVTQTAHFILYVFIAVMLIGLGVLFLSRRARRR